MPALPLETRPTSPPAARTPGDRPVALFVLTLVVGLLAVPCGIVLIINGLGMPRSILAATPFDSFLIPGLVLTVVVGGTLLGAAWLIRVRHPRAWLASLAAGVILLGWIVIESVMIADGRGLQVFILVTALLIIGLAWRERPGPACPTAAGPP